MLRTLVLLFALVLAPVTAAEEEVAAGPIVVELFTSQGCSACPPADRILMELAEYEDVLPLSLHVDYWDYIGWEDGFADPAHTHRQKAYAAQAGKRMIYTPQMVVQGRQRVPGTKPGALLEAIRSHMGGPGAVALEAAMGAGSVRIEARSAEPFDPPLAVHLVRYAPRRSASISTGENAGHELDYANVVSAWETVAEWDGRAPLSLVVDAAGDDQAAVLVQRSGPGDIVAAARAE